MFLGFMIFDNFFKFKKTDSQKIDLHREKELFRLFEIELFFLFILS